MPSIWPAGDTGLAFSVPLYTDPADAVAAFQSYSTQLTLLLPPIGTVVPYLGTSAPPGWLMCNGSGPYKTADFPYLAALLGASGETFFAPNLMGRTVVGVDPQDTTMDRVLDIGGSKTVQLAEENLAKHKHTTGAHTHDLTGTVTAASADVKHTHTATAKDGGSHQHDSRINEATNFDRSGSAKGTVWVGSNTDKLTAQGGNHTHAVDVTEAAGSHVHTVTSTLKVGQAQGDSTGETGASKPFAIQSPFIALNWIVRAA